MVKFGLAATGTIANEEAIRSWISGCFQEYGSISGADECYSDMNSYGIVFADEALNAGNGLICVYPFEAEHRDEIKVYEDQANALVYMNEKMSNDSAAARDRYIVNSCDVLLAVWDGATYGKVYNMVEQARAENKTVVVYAG